MRVSVTRYEVIVMWLGYSNVQGKFMPEEQYDIISTQEEVLRGV